MEVCECSLAEVFLCDKHPMEMCKCYSHRIQSCHSFSVKARNCQEYMDAFAHFTGMLRDILNGLLYLQNMGCTHKGLKLSNVLVGIFSVFFDGCDLYIYTQYIHIGFIKCRTCFRRTFAQQITRKIYLETFNMIYFIKVQVYIPLSLYTFLRVKRDIDIFFKIHINIQTF